MPSTLAGTVRLAAEKVCNPSALGGYGGICSDHPVLVILAAGKGTRFGVAPKCAQAVCGLPLARHSINAYRQFRSAPVICVVGYRHEEVMTALGDDNLYVLSDNPTGGTAYAASEIFSVEALLDADPLLIVTMGDRIVTTDVFRRLHETHRLGPREGDLTFLTAMYESPRNRGKGRVVRSLDGRVERIVEQRDIDALADAFQRERLDKLTEGNCPLYVIRARELWSALQPLTNNNAQGQFYLTDIVNRIASSGGDIRTVTISPQDPEYDLLCSDVTRPMDLAVLESRVASSIPSVARGSVAEATRAIVEHRPAGQIAAIAAQLEELVATARHEQLGFLPETPVGLGISGGRIRIAFMHPDMGRFFGPAWQMPFGARDERGREQIVVVVQSSQDGKIHLFPTNPEFREKTNSVAADNEAMYPGDDVADWYTYEGFGTRMAEVLLLSLGYFTDEEVQARRARNLPLPPPGLWVSNSLRRPFSLIGNAIASMRTLRTGNLGAKVQTYLGRHAFRGLRVMSTGNIPQGGFSSSSAVTVAVKNALNALFDLQISPDVLIHLACQAEYGTGVRAGALDQATEQKGRPGEGTLISSNPRDNYRILGTYPIPTDRIHILFAYSVDRDRVAWKWSGGTYSGAPEPGKLTAGEMRKMTGKAAEIAAILLRLPLESDFFPAIQQDLLTRGRLSAASHEQVVKWLRQLPSHISQKDLRARLNEQRSWYIEQLLETQKLSVDEAAERTDTTFAQLLAGWRDPILQRCAKDGTIRQERGAPLRAMVAYLFAEVAKNFQLIYHPDKWIAWVDASQRGDRCFWIDPDRLPSMEDMLSELPWERDVSGPDRLKRWLEHCHAVPFDYNRDIEDDDLIELNGRALHELRGTNFFRGLALIDLAGAMLQRAFGKDTIAVRVNAAGQGDFFQIHLDTQRVGVDQVKEFLGRAFYERFGLSVKQPFVEPFPGGGAVGVRLSRFDLLPALVQQLRRHVAAD